MSYMISLDIEEDCGVETWKINFYGNWMFQVYIFDPTVARRTRLKRLLE